MTPKEIISKQIIGIHGIRIPMGKIVTENILHELKDHGYIIIEERALRTFNKKEDKNAEQ